MMDVGECTTPPWIVFGRRSVVHLTDVGIGTIVQSPFGGGKIFLILWYATCDAESCVFGKILWSCVIEEGYPDRPQKLA